MEHSHQRILSLFSDFNEISQRENLKYSLYRHLLQVPVCSSSYSFSPLIDRQQKNVTHNIFLILDHFKCLIWSAPSIHHWVCFHHYLHLTPRYLEEGASLLIPMYFRGNDFYVTSFQRLNTLELIWKSFRSSVFWSYLHSQHFRAQTSSTPPLWASAPLLEKQQHFLWFHGTQSGTHSTFSADLWLRGLAIHKSCCLTSLR